MVRDVLWNKVWYNESVEGAVKADVRDVLWNKVWYNSYLEHS